MQALDFVVDVPLRLDEWLPPHELDRRERKGRIGFTLVEFQMLDAETPRPTNKEDSAHARYKHRQKLSVPRRLSRGLVIPRVAEPEGDAE